MPFLTRMCGWRRDEPYEELWEGRQRSTIGRAEAVQCFTVARWHGFDTGSETAGVLLSSTSAEKSSGNDDTLVLEEGVRVLSQPRARDPFPVVPPVAAEVCLILASEDWVIATLCSASSSSMLSAEMLAFLSPGAKVRSPVLIQGLTKVLLPSASCSRFESLAAAAGYKVSFSDTCGVVSVVGCTSVTGPLQSVLQDIPNTVETFEDSETSVAVINLVVTAQTLEKVPALSAARRLYSAIFRNYPRATSERFVSELRERRDRWWRSPAILARLRDEAKVGATVYCYHPPLVRERCLALLALPAVSRVFFAIKANPNPDLLRVIRGVHDDAGKRLGFECVSVGEVQHLLDLFGEEIAPAILFTPNFAERADFQFAFDHGLGFVTIDSVEPIALWPEVFRSRDIVVRVDPGGKGLGHHDFVRTAGKASKFGVSPSDLPKLAAACASNQTCVVGLHSHHGSGILNDTGAWARTAEFLLNDVVRLIPSLQDSVRHLDLGGGFGVPEREDESPLDLAATSAALTEFRERYVDSPELWLEPGRFVVAECGILLARVTQVKHKDGVCWVGTNGGFASLIRPAFYGSHHEIYNISRDDDGTMMVCHVVGNICESGDFIGRSRELPYATAPGDILLIDVSGAYGRSMSSNYNMHGLPREVLIE